MYKYRMTELTLRERKYAATKAALTQALVARLKTESLDEIPVKAVCAEAQVSEATFFNYFPTKAAAVGYRVQLWSIEAQWAMQHCLATGGSHLAAVRELFATVARAEETTPGVMREVVVFQARHSLAFSPLTRAEYALHFPARVGVERLQALGVDQLLRAGLQAAQKAGELSPDLDLDAFTITLMSVFFLTPLLASAQHRGTLSEHYRRQLDILLSAGLPPPSRKARHS